VFAALNSELGLFVRTQSPSRRRRLRASALVLRPLGFGSPPSQTSPKRAVAGRARWAQEALVNGRVGLIFAPRGRLLLVLLPTIRDRRVVGLELIAEPHRLRSLE